MYRSNLNRLGSLRKRTDGLVVPLLWAIVAFVVLVCPPGVSAEQDPDERVLIEKLRRGGYNLYFRHAPTDWSQSDRVRKPGDWTSCDPGKMRQLSEDGRKMARRIGRALRDLDIPVGEILSSPYCRVAETARLMDLGEVTTTRRIMNMRAAEYVGGRTAVVRRARAVLADTPPARTNRVIVGHGNLMRAATDSYAKEGGSGIFVPDADSDRGFELVVRLSPADWFRLSENLSENGSRTN